MTKKQILRTVCFVLVFAIVFLTLQSILMSNSNNTRRIKGLYAEEKNSLDVIYVGESCVETFVSPTLIYDKYGITGYDLCIDQTSIGLYKLLIEEALRTQNPDTIVIKLTFGREPTNEQKRAIIDNMRWSDSKIKAIKEYGEDTFSTFIFPISYYHTRWKDISSALGYTYFMIFENLNYKALEEYSAKSLYLDKVYPLKGFFTSGNVAKISTDEDWQPTCETLYPGEEYMTMLSELVSYLDTLEGNVVFVNTPRPDANNSNRQKMFNFVADYLRTEGYTFIDYNFKTKEMDFDFTTDMGDTAHANIKGAVKFSKLLGADISEITKSTPKDKDTQADWKKAVGVWKNCLEYYGIKE